MLGIMAGMDQAALVSVDTTLVSVDTALVSVDTSLVSVDTFLVSEDTDFFGRSKRFRAEDHLPVPLETAIQTFLCGGSRLPFGDGVFQSRHCFSLAVVLRTCTCRHVYWRCGITPGLQVSWHVFVCLARSVLLSTVRRLGQRYVRAPLLRFSFSCRFFEFVLCLL